MFEVYNEFSVQELIASLSGSDNLNDLELLIRKLKISNLKPCDYAEIWKKFERFRNIILLESPRYIVIYLSLIDANINYVLVKEVLGDLNKEESARMLNSLSPELRKYAIYYANLHRLVHELAERLSKEDDEIIVSEILKVLRNYKISYKDSCMLLNSKLATVSSYAAKFVHKKYVIERLKKEKEYYAKIKIAQSLATYHELTEKDVRTFMDDSDINVMFMRYCSLKNIIKILNSSDFRGTPANIESVINIIKTKTISSEHARELLNCNYEKIRKFAIKYAVKTDLVKRLKYEKSIEVVDLIFKELEDYNIPQTKSNEIFFMSELVCVRRYVFNNVTKDAILKNLVKEKDEFIINKSFERLGKTKISSNMATNFINASSSIVRKWAIKFVSKDILEKRLLDETNKEVIDEIMVALKSL